tara:strand:- start:342 stop:584 length:243 start_codon:yes stop_codon:yes gene_type:complete
MNDEQVKKSFDKIAETLFAISKELQQLEKHTKFQMDSKAISDIVLDLTWATENCSVIGLHQIDEALEDNMGTGISPELKK